MNKYMTISKEAVMKEEELILSFLNKAKEGMYGIVEKSSIPYARLQEETIIVDTENYYFGIS